MSGDPFLPYRCEVLNAEFLRPPCIKKLAQLKEVREKFSGAYLGPLEHCAACKGNNLIIRVAPPELRPAPAAAASPPAQKEENMAGVVKFKDEDEANRVLGAGKIKTLRPGEEIRLADNETVVPIVIGQFCKLHAEVEAHKTKSGRFMGLCLQCLRDLAARNSRNRVGKGTAAPEDLTTPQSLKHRVAALGETAAVEVAASFAAKVTPLPSGARGMPPPLHPDLACKNHLDRPARIDRLGRTMRFCQECLAARGRKTGSQNFTNQTPPFSIPLNVPEFAEVKEWLVAQAAEYERTLAREIMYRLKLAMRAAAVLG